MATRGYLDRPENNRKLRAMLTEGKSSRQIAAALSTRRETVSSRAVEYWRARHADEIEGTKHDLEQQALGIAIASKRFRLNALEALFVPMYARVLEDGPVVETRTVDEETGEIVVLSVKAHPLLPQLLRYLRAAAEEMGQIPRWQAPSEGQGYGTPGDVALAQNVETQNVIIYRGGPDLNMTP